LSEKIEASQKTLEELEKELKDFGYGLRELIKHKFMIQPKWNNLDEIAEEYDLYVTKDQTVKIDIIELQAILFDAFDEFSELLKPFIFSKLGLVAELKKQAIDRNDIDEEWENNDCQSLEELEKLRKKKFISLDNLLVLLRGEQK